MLFRQLSRTTSSNLPRFTRPIQLSSHRVVYHSIPTKPPARLRRPHYPFGLLAATSVLAQQSPSRPDALARRRFHATPRAQAIPIAGLLGLLKASTVLEVVRATSRIALTFIPIILVKNFFTRKFLQRVDHIQKKHAGEQCMHSCHNEEKFTEKRTRLMKGLRTRAIIFHLLMFSPFALFGLAVLASLERTPITGRWRTILLSPEEEEAISKQLAGQGWYQAVADIFAREGPPPKLIPPTDWRYVWVYNTLRQLESEIPRLGDEQALEPDWASRPDDDMPFPPPSDYPLRPRPRVSEHIRLFRCSVTGEKPSRGMMSHHIPGPPYALLLVDDPTAANAFSYGFGPDGAGGVVVFSGFIDRILADNPTPPPSPAPTSWWTSLLGSAPPPRVAPQPTPEQTADLAVLLSHELSHLVLAHHLETLSSMTVLFPGTLSILSDVLRTLLFPMTMLFGPFVNDALASLGAAGSLELSRCGEYCTTAHQEIEADAVSARLLAHAGFDPRRAVRFLARHQAAECAPGAAGEQRQHGHLAMKLFGAGHPLSEVRAQKLERELERWREERMRVLEQRAREAKQPE
ncbi:hypothetical protein K488DRAFT_78082 [Vararia minispora EC-137]|uniref:Uncharacterized protein n=1 Tax=Vararia minispora EC-137 TaxID=1314806 RepID=A0ACB8QN28_9AGAM|nr:hypothetical protein K488DRAFT_78082 [Vararia minispora EC-137]